MPVTATSTPLILTASSIPPPAATPEPTVAAVADRTSCTEIRGTDYRSDSERAWFAANCASAPQIESAGRNQSTLVTTASMGCAQNELTEQQVRGRTEYPYFFELRSGGFALAKRGTTGTVVFYEPLLKGCFYLVETKEVLGLCADGTWLVNDVHASFCASLSTINLWLSTRLQPGTARPPMPTPTPEERPRFNDRQS
jgi:hypothetical protein